MASAAENRRGIIAMLAAMMFFVGNDVFMKLARETYPVGQAIALRTVFALLVGIALVLALGDHRKLGSALQRPVLIRGVIEAMVALSFIWALGHLPIANITAITLASPIIIVVIAVLLGMEKVGWRRTIAVMVGFLGVLIVVRPGADGFSPAALVALFSAVLVSARDLMTRGIGGDVPSTVISLATTLIVGVAALGYGLTEQWQPIWRAETLHLALAAVMVATGSLFIVDAFRNTDASVIAGFRYAVVLMALATGYLIWGDVPDGLAFVGMALIVGAGLYTMHRQRVRPDSNLKLPAGPPP